MKNGFQIILSVIVCGLLCPVSSDAFQTNTRGVQTAPPRSTMQSSSPRVIDFTRPGQSNPQNSNAALRKSTQIPLQNLPFGERTPRDFTAPQGNQAAQFMRDANANARNAGQNLVNGASQFGQNVNGAGQGFMSKANAAGRKFWENAAKPFKMNKDNERPPMFTIPENLNRKPNYTEAQVLTDQRNSPMQGINLFQKPKLPKPPKWLADMNQKTKDLFNFNKSKQQAGPIQPNNWNNQATANMRERGNQAWQEFNGNAAPQTGSTPGISPQNWSLPRGNESPAAPATRTANQRYDLNRTNRR